MKLPPLNVPAMAAERRFSLLITLGYIVGCLSRSEREWLGSLVAAYWAGKPDPNTSTPGEYGV